MAATDITGQLARFMGQAEDTGLPHEIAQAGKHRTLDTLADVNEFMPSLALTPEEMNIVRYRH